MKTGALIIASGDYGEEQRDNEGIPVFLPMYPLDGTTVIKGEIAKLRKAGVSPIVVLAGCHSETLKLHLSHNNVIFLEDEAYREHSFEETLAIGLTGCAPLMERVLVLPVEYPACADSTIKALLAAEKSAVPTYDGQEGWPRSMILSGTEMDPTEKINFNFETGSRFLPTEDPGVTYSLQEEGGVERVTRYLKARWNAATLHFKTKLVISKEEDFFGPGVYHLLQYIDETGSIQAAGGQNEYVLFQGLENDQQGGEGAGLPLPEPLQRRKERRQLYHHPRRPPLHGAVSCHAGGYETDYPGIF